MKDIKDYIQNELNMSIREFAQKNNFDFNTVNNFLNEKTSGAIKNSKAYKFKQFLIKNGFLIEKKKNIEIDIDNIKISTLKNYYLYKYYELIDKKYLPEKILEYFKSKIPSILDLYFDKSVKDYINDEYFKQRYITQINFHHYCLSISTGDKKNSKAFFIKKKLIQDGIFPKFNIY